MHAYIACYIFLIFVLNFSVYLTLRLHFFEKFKIPYHTYFRSMHRFFLEKASTIHLDLVTFSTRSEFTVTTSFLTLRNDLASRKPSWKTATNFPLKESTTVVKTNFLPFAEQSVWLWSRDVSALKLRSFNKQTYT